jgi:transposase
MKHHDTPPLPAIAFQAVANMAPRDEVPEQASFPWYASSMLAYESFEVIRLRLEKILLGGDDAHHEVRLMVSEKVDAMIEAGASLMAGATPASIVDRYREHVAANTKRLSAI